MEHRDLIKDQIEQFGRALGQILSDFLRLKSKGQVFEGIEITTQRLQGELDIDLVKIRDLSKEDLLDYLIKRRLTAVHLEILSDYLKEVGRVEIESNSADANMRLSKAIELLDIADDISNTVSFERIDKRKEIGQLLQGLSS